MTKTLTLEDKGTFQKKAVLRDDGTFAVFYDLKGKTIYPQAYTLSPQNIREMNEAQAGML